MPRGRQVEIRVQEEVERLALRRYTPAQVYGHLKKLGLIDAGGSPSQKTIQRMVKALSPPDPSEPWSFDGDDPDDARHVLAVLPSVLAWTDGAGWPTRDLAACIVRVRTAIPTAPALVVYALADRYRTLAAEPRSARALDVILATRPWEDEAASSRCRGLLAALGREDRMWGAIVLATLILLPKSDDEIEREKARTVEPEA